MRFSFSDKTSLDLELKVHAFQAVSGFEAFIASYPSHCPEAYVPLKGGWYRAVRRVGDILWFLRDNKSRKLILDGRWSGFTPVIPGELKYPILIALGPDRKYALIQFLEPAYVNYAVLCPNEGEADWDYANDFSIGSDLKSGDEFVSRGRLTYDRWDKLQGTIEQYLPP